MKPEVCHMFWGGEPMSWIRYKSIESFKRHNPGIPIILWMPKVSCDIRTWGSYEYSVKYVGRSWLDECVHTCISQVIWTDACEDLANIHKSDLVRLHALYDYGGMYCDTDILWVKPIDIDREPEQLAISYIGVWANGLLVSNRHNSILADVLVESSTCDIFRYEGFGHDLFDSVIKVDDPRVKILDPCIVNPVVSKCVDLIWNDTVELGPQTLGLHWFGGHPRSGAVENAVSSESGLPDCTFKRYLENVSGDKP